MAASPIEVVLFDGSTVAARAEAELDAAVFAGQTLYDDHVENIGAYFAGARKLEVGFYVDGKLARMVAGRPS